MSTRCVLLIFDAVADAWWFYCEPVLAINLRCVMTWIALLNGSSLEYVPLRVFPLLCLGNTLGWNTVYVVIASSRPFRLTIQSPSVDHLVFDLGLPRGWQPGDLWPAVPLIVRFRWEFAAGSANDSLDSSALLLNFTRSYHTHSPPASLRRGWHDLSAHICSPCTPVDTGLT